MPDASEEERMNLALDAFGKGQFPSIRKAAAAFDVPPSTLMTRVNGRTARKDRTANCRKLNETEEETLSEWILDMTQRGFPLQISTVRHLAQLLLSARLKRSENATIGENWVTCFINRHKELRSKYTQNYDYQRAKCESPELIKGWFERVHDTIQQYGILAEDIYNMDETGFKMGHISTSKVICSAEIRQRCARVIQSSNRECATAIIAVNSTGWTLPPQIILAAEDHQSHWYHTIPKDYTISVSKNGWTNDELALYWLQNIFERYTASRTVGRYRMLILDGHGSHATAGFDKFCMDRRIIPLYMPPNSSHLLQPLDVCCFSPLKHLYGQKIQEMIRYNIPSIGKEDFLYIYPTVHQNALSSSNIQNGFASTGLIPLSPERVLAKLQIQLNTPTPPSTSHSMQALGTGKTPADINQLEHQKERILHLQSHQISPTIIDQAVQKIMKSAEMTMQNALLLQEEVSHLRRANQRQKRRKLHLRQFIQHGGRLTSEDLQKAQEEEALRPTSRPRRPPTCSTCGTMGHNRLQCSRE